jgi:hypothetical protein
MAVSKAKDYIVTAATAAAVALGHGVLDSLLQTLHGMSMIGCFFSDYSLNSVQGTF